MNSSIEQFQFENICSSTQLNLNKFEEERNIMEELFDGFASFFIDHLENNSTESLLKNETLVERFVNWTLNNTSLKRTNDTIDNVLNSTRRQEFLNSFQKFVNKLNPEYYPAIIKKEFVNNTIIVVAYLLIIAVSLFGNTLVLYIIFSQRQLRVQITNQLIANLTFSDFLLTTLNIPLTIVRLLFDNWPLGSILCHLGPLVQAISVYVSTLTMVVIAIDRHRIFLGSFSNSVSVQTPGRWIIITIWILSAIFSIPHFIFNKVVYKQSYTCLKRCQAVYPSPTLQYSKMITIFTLLSQYVLPLSITGFCYTKISWFIWKRGRIGEMTDTQNYSRIQAKIRTIKIMVLVVIVFAICWLPINFYHLYLDFYPNSFYNKSTFTICHWIGLSSICYNPFIYFWLNKQYKERALTIIRTCFQCNCLSVNKDTSTNNLSNRKSNSSFNARNKETGELVETLN